MITIRAPRQKYENYCYNTKAKGQKPMSYKAWLKMATRQVSL